MENVLFLLLIKRGFGDSEWPLVCVGPSWSLRETKFYRVRCESIPDSRERGSLPTRNTILLWFYLTCVWLSLTEHPTCALGFDLSILVRSVWPFLLFRALGTDLSHLCVSGPWSLLLFSPTSNADPGNARLRRGQPHGKQPHACLLSSEAAHLRSLPLLSLFSPWFSLHLFFCPFLFPWFLIVLFLVI